MASPSKNILVIGGTGTIGKHLTNALLDAEGFKVGVFTSPKTRETKGELLDSYKARGAEIIVGDLHSADDVLGAYKSFDTVVSALGRDVIETQLALITLASQSPSITRFFPSEYGTDVAYDATSSTERPSVKKVKVRALLESPAVRTSLRHTYLVTGPYAEMYVNFSSVAPRAGGFDPKARRALLLGEGGRPRVSLMTMPDVGRLLVAALRHPEVCDDRAVRVNSFTTSPAEILAEFEKQTGESWDKESVMVEELRGLEEEAWREGSAAATVCTLRRIWTEGRTLYEKRDNEAIGVTETDTLEKVVRDAICKAG